jgi:hypothetical protein
MTNGDMTSIDMFKQLYILNYDVGFGYLFVSMRVPLVKISAQPRSQISTYHSFTA